MIRNSLLSSSIITFERDVMSVASGSDGDGVLEERGGEVDLASVLTSMGQRKRRERESVVIRLNQHYSIVTPAVCDGRTEIFST